MLAARELHGFTCSCPFLYGLASKLLGAQVPPEVNSMTPFSRLCFSPDQSMLAAGVEGRIHVLEGFKGDHLFSVDTGVPAGGSALDFCFSPDSQYLLAGAVWKSPQRVARLGNRLG